MNREPMNRAEQNRSMEDQQEGKKAGEQNPSATPPFSLRLRILFLIIFHEHFTLWTGRGKSKGERTRLACIRQAGSDRWRPRHGELLSSQNIAARRRNRHARRVRSPEIDITQRPGIFG